MRGRDIMVPLPEKRHRIYEDELEQVTKGLILRLGELLESEEDQESVKVVFRIMFRFLNLRRGRPDYPEFSWSAARQMYETYNDQLPDL